MKLKRLDRILVKILKQSNKTVRKFITNGSVQVNGVTTTERTKQVTPFCTLSINNEIVREKKAYYIMLHKPKAYLSATNDSFHRCVTEILKDQPFCHELHLVGRLDFFTTGLLLLTNDGHWSSNISNPLIGKKIPKKYLVTTLKKIDNFEEAALRFRNGLYLPDNNVTCRPAVLEKYENNNSRSSGGGGSGTSKFSSNSSSRSPKTKKRKRSYSPKTMEIAQQHKYWITIFEGKRHQVKCMINAISNGENRVIELHRYSIGNLTLSIPENNVLHSKTESVTNELQVGQWRHLTENEVNYFESTTNGGGSGEWISPIDQYA